MSRSTESSSRHWPTIEYTQHDITTRLIDLYVGQRTHSAGSAPRYHATVRPVAEFRRSRSPAQHDATSIAVPNPGAGANRASRRMLVRHVTQGMCSLRRQEWIKRGDVTRSPRTLPGCQADAYPVSFAGCQARVFRALLLCSRTTSLRGGSVWLIPSLPPSEPGSPNDAGSATAATDRPRERLCGERKSSSTKQTNRPPRARSQTRSACWIGPRRRASSIQITPPAANLD